MQKELIPKEIIEGKIYLIRSQKVMLDSDLALLYKVSTKVLNQAVKRNKKRFPEDFMFKLNKEEYQDLISQNAISNTDLRSQFATSSWGGRRYHPHAFTEQGVAMLSSVLNSDRAIEVNIQIIRTFVKLRQILATHAELQKKVEAMEKRFDGQLRIVFEILKKLNDVEVKPKKKIGFLSKNS